MSEILIAALSPIGHIGPLLNVARGLVDRGDRVTVLSGAARADQIRATGATPATLPPQGDLDLALLESDSGREKTSGVKRLNFDIVRLFVAPMPHQAKALTELLAQKRFDAILADYGFFGVLPFATRRRRRAAAGAALLHDPADDQQPRHRSRRAWAAAVDEFARPTAESHPEHGVAEGLAASVAEGRQLPAAPAQFPCAADLPVRFRSAGRPPHRADGARVRLSAHRPAGQRPLCRHGASVADGEVPSADVVVEARRRPPGRARHPGHHRQRRLQPGCCGRPSRRSQKRT